MPIIRLQGDNERRRGISYQYNSECQPLGEGGMGRVYEGVCVDERNGSTRPVAIKQMFDHLPANAYERARREAEIQLRNDNLIEMLGFIETMERTPLGEMQKRCYVVSELLTGVSLSDVLEGKTKDREGEDVSFAVKLLQDFKNDPEHFAKTIVINILSGLMALHDAGYIHRDIDPSNIMLTSDGRIKLIDFGIAKQMNNLTTGDKSLTVAGKFMGKPEYAAPELVLGDINHQNQTTDIYAVGILLYQCIIGHTPFEGARHEILEMQMKAKMPLGKIKEKALRKIIQTACEKKQELRYQTSAQMRVALETINGSRQAMSAQKKYSLMAIAIAVPLLLASIVFIVKHKQNEARKEAENARIEQQQHEIVTNIEQKVGEAQRIAQMGLEKANEDNYELELIKAYESYTEAEDIAKKNPDVGYDTKDIAAKKENLLTALDSAQVERENQAVRLTEMGATELAHTYQERAKAIKDYKAKLK